MHSAILISIFVLILLLVVLQVLWIRSKLGDLRDKQMISIGNADSTNKQRDATRGYMSLYSVIIDVKTTLRCNDVSRHFYESLEAANTNTEFVLPNTCENGKVENISTKSRKLGFLVCKRNASSMALEEDIKNGNVYYIVAKNQMMIITYKDEIQAIVENSGIPTSSVIAFTLHGIPNLNLENKCSVNMLSFMGNTKLNDSDSLASIDFRVVLGLGADSGSMFELPMQLIGYKVG